MMPARRLAGDCYVASSSPVHSPSGCEKSPHTLRLREPNPRRMTGIVIILLLCEWIVFIVVSALYLIKLIRFARQGIKIKQGNVRLRGHALALVGIVIGIGLPNVLGIQNNFSDSADLIYLLVTTIGTCILLVGWRLILASYKPEEETPKWISSVTNFWK